MNVVLFLALIASTIALGGYIGHRRERAEKRLDNRRGDYR